MNTPTAVPQSTFITVLAWIMIVFGAFGIFVGLLQNIMVNFVFPAFEAAMPHGGRGGAFPLAFARSLMILALTFSAFLTYAAYALLKRRNWARITFIVLFVISAVLHVIMAALLGLGVGLTGFLMAGSEIMPAAVQSAMRVMTISFAIFLLAMAVMYVWLMQRLRSPAVVAEFAIGA
jgi:hypothetical protein